ncbi:30S ribosomal protein S20 [Usitatibacter palustris]|uniref:Small ribosomal subunit protein bS20 n=1 Tax=Usitatibacter palustris TaxID=2732487 RepID=A0A6M4HCD8_9PROT|nr:30S ribosomal protein S20 [Usitatibacter palustris]QJR16408.1 30S ribosomal protein S20 [Usitatibacter palustris]
MANTKQAAKRARKSTQQRASNMSLRTTLRSAIKKVQKAIGVGDAKAAATSLDKESSTIDRMASRKIIHRNKAARHKSRLAKRVKALAKQA